MNYDEARQYIEEAGKYGMVFGLSSMRNLLSRLGNPQNKLSFIHIAGTNGKGSTGAYLNEILRTAGIKTGRYVSPALFSYEERVQISDKNGTEYISKWNVAKWISAIEFAVEEMVENGLPHPTPFEMETAMAFMEFEDQGCELVVLETGLGGGLDATNVIKTGVCQVFTAISRDHMGILGETLTEIATEKSGIIKKGVPVVSWPQEKEAEEVLTAKAEEMESSFKKADFSKLSVEEMTLAGTRFYYKGEEFETVLLGENQPKNAAVAIEAAWELERQGFSIGTEKIKAGIKNAQWPGRFTVISKEPLVIIDGAHNEAAAQSLAKSLKQYFKQGDAAVETAEFTAAEKKLIGVIGVFRDKEYDKVLKETLPLMEKAYTLKPAGPRGLEAETLAECGRQYCKEVTACQSAAEALEKAIEAARILGSNTADEWKENVKDAEGTANQRSNKDVAVIVYGSLSFLHEITEKMQEQ